jgi:beta-N-acetylhexosaminidase
MVTRQAPTDFEILHYGNAQMTVESSLALAPFHLSVGDIAWVRKTRDGLSVEDKVRQLFVHITIGDDPHQMRELAERKPGGIHRFMGPKLTDAWAATRLALEMSELPPFITGDIEGGGHGSPSMLQFPNPLGLAAANDLELSRQVLEAVCAEAKALGFNWSFTPVLDVNQNMASAIVGTRSFGSDVEKVMSQARLHIKTLQAHGIAATAKHWPGEGFDARDQHLVTTINPLSVGAWHDMFGHLYKTAIDDGVMSVMSAHIALPAYAAAKGIAAGLERYRPASVSKLLNMELLRGELGFNGLITSDATPMAGLTAWSKRAITAPEVIENGCDVFLFSTDADKDFSYMMEGLRDGRLSEQRLNDAVTRILGLKAALGLYQKSIDERLPPLAIATAIVKRPAHLAAANAAAEKSITLVKDTQDLLPLDLAKHRRVVLVSRGAPGLFPFMPRKPMSAFVDGLKEAGFEVREFDAANPPTTDDTDLLVFVFAVESSLGQSHIFIDWMTELPGFNVAMERFWHDIPTLMISFGHPYYLRDAPRVPTYVNAYSTIEAAQLATLGRILGRAKFEGTSPVDAFAGADDAHY